MRVPGWAVLAAVLLVACDKGEATTSEPPESVGAPDSRGLAAKIEGPPASLRRELRLCEQATPGAFGEVEYGVRVSPAGQVVLVKALRSNAPPALLNCTLQRLRGWGFPTTADGAAFRFSMEFGKQGRAPVRADKEQLKDALKHRAAQLQGCYNRALRKDPTIAGKMSYVLLISTSGSVQAAVEENTGLPPDVADCTIDVIESWTFPMDGATVGADLSFSVVFVGS